MRAARAAEQERASPLVRAVPDPRTQLPWVEAHAAQPLLPDPLRVVREVVAVQHDREVRRLWAEAPRRPPVAEGAWI